MQYTFPSLDYVLQKNFLLGPQKHSILDEALTSKGLSTSTLMHVVAT